MNGLEVSNLNNSIPFTIIPYYWINYNSEVNSNANRKLKFLYKIAKGTIPGSIILIIISFLIIFIKYIKKYKLFQKIYLCRRTKKLEMENIDIYYDDNNQNNYIIPNNIKMEI